MNGTMIRWGMMIFGLLLMIASAHSWLTHKPLDESPTDFTLAQAQQWLAGDEERTFVTLSGTLDTANRLYRTHLADPSYCLLPAHEIVNLSGPDAPPTASLHEFRGCMARVSAHLNPDTIGMVQHVWVEDGQSVEEGEVSREKYIAPVPGTNGMLFVLSPSFGPQDAASSTWLARDSFTGRLARFADMDRNASGLAKSPEEIANIMRSWGVLVSDSSLVIMTEFENAVESGSTLVPLLDSDSTLFVEVDAQREAEIARTGVITGMLKPLPQSEHHEIAFALGSLSIPAVVGLLTDQTAAEYNAGVAALHQTGFMAGLLFFGFGFGTTWLLHKIKRRNAQKQADLFDSLLNPPPPARPTIDGSSCSDRFAA